MKLLISSHKRSVGTETFTEQNYNINGDLNVPAVPVTVNVLSIQFNNPPTNTVDFKITLYGVIGLVDSLSDNIYASDTEIIISPGFDFTMGGNHGTVINQNFKVEPMSASSEEIEMIYTIAHGTTKPLTV